MKKQWILVGILTASVGAGSVLAQHQAPKDQPVRADEAAAPTGEMALGSVRIPRPVTADGKPLPAGTYTVRLTTQPSKPDAVGASENLERWVEFVQGKEVKGREVVTIVPAAETKLVAKDAPPAPGSAKVQLLKGNEYLRVWINRAGTHFLIHLPAAQS